jgi:hypothetical protein
MAKVHLRNGKINVGLAKCGNNGRNYAFGLECVGPQEFKAVPAASRCAHCEDIFLKERNRQRKAKGLRPVSVWHEGFEVAK